LIIKTHHDLYSFINDLKDWPKLKVLNIEENPILSEIPEYNQEDNESKGLMQIYIFRPFVEEWKKKNKKESDEMFIKS
jgi:hypothetical protein